MFERRKDMLRRPFLFGSLALISLVVACGGGGGSGGSAGSGGGSSSGGGPPATLPMGTVQFTVTQPISSAPPIASSSRSPQFAVPGSTQSVSIVLTQVNGSPPPSPSVLNENLGSGSPGCTASSTTLTCLFSAQEPAGSDGFSVLTYSQQNQAGGTLGGGSMNVNVTAGQSVQAPATLTGTVASISVAVVGSVPEGVATSLPLDVVAKDSSGNTIIGTYNNPIALVDSDTSGATSLSVKSLTTAGAVALAYNGSPMSAPVSISASASGVPATSITAASFLPQSSAPTVNGATVTEAGSGTVVFKTIASPGPTPTPSVETSTMSITYSTGATYNGISGLVQVATTQVVTSPSPSASPLVSDDYYQWAPGVAAGSWAYDYIGGTSVDSGDQFSTTTCSAPYIANWIVPIPQTWSPPLAGTGPCTYTWSAISPYAVPYSESEVENADGSYSNTTTYPVSAQFPTGETDTSLVRSDGTALLTVNNATSGSSIVAVGTPAPGSASIPLEVQAFTGALPSPGASSTPAPVATSEPNWYNDAGLPSGAVPSPLLSQTISTIGTASLPTQCAVPASVLGTSPTVTEVDIASTDLDPTNGYDTSLERSFIVDGLGDVCDVGTYTYFSNFDVSDAEYGASYFNTTKSVDTWADYVTASSLTAAMLATKSFADALPAASHVLYLGSAVDMERARAQARARVAEQMLQRRLALRHR